jgi:hypothetical protein
VPQLVVLARNIGIDIGRRRRNGDGTTAEQLLLLECECLRTSNAVFCFLIVLSVAAGSIVHFQLLATVLLHSLLLSFELSECRLVPRLGHDKLRSGFWRIQNPHHHEQLHVAQMLKCVHGCGGGGDCFRCRRWCGRLRVFLTIFHRSHASTATLALGRLYLGRGSPGTVFDGTQTATAIVASHRHFLTTTSLALGRFHCCSD